jgi:ParB family chromosome partitioning protein
VIHANFVPFFDNPILVFITASCREGALMIQAERENVEYIPWHQIVPDPAQPREDIPPEHVGRVAVSIRNRGMLQYLRVRFDAALGKFVIITGHCRWLACEQAGLDPVPCIVVKGDLSEEAVLQDQITENELRRGFTPGELARALARLKALKGITSQQLAAELGISGASMTRSEALLSLPADLLRMIDDGIVAASLGYEISRHPDPVAQQELARAVAAGQITRVQVIDAVQAHIGKRKASPKNGRMSCRIDGGISVTVTRAGQSLTKADVLLAVERLRKEAKKLEEAGEVPEMARAS